MTRVAAIIGGLFLWLLQGGSALAHPLAPAFLELRESAEGYHAVLWRQPIARTERVELSPVLPANCRQLGEVATSFEQGVAIVSRWQLDCRPAGLTGQMLAVAGLEHSIVNVILRIEDAQGRIVHGLLDAEHAQFEVPPPMAPPPVFSRYLVLGVEHLLTGLDHVLFVSGLFLLVQGLRRLVITITAFTLGHSLTLALATLGMVQVNSAMIELAIALSIFVLARELAPGQISLARTGGGPQMRDPGSFFHRWPWLMAATFGLLHGLGFAGALSEVGLPAGEIPLALFAFNLGIEAGQLLLVMVLLLLARLWIAIRVRPLGWLPASAAVTAALIPAYVIGSLAAFWCIERAFLLLA